MATEEINKAKKMRSVARRNFSSVASKLEKVLCSDEPETSKVTMYYDLLRQKHETLTKLEENVRELLIVNNDSEEGIDKDIEEADEYEERWISLGLRYKELTELDARSVYSNCTTNKRSPRLECMDNVNEKGMKQNFHYPKLEFTKFDGNPQNWIKFWGQFSNIDNDESLGNYQKFQYLIQATEKKAREVVRSFPPSAENYQIALSHLKERFGRETLIIEVYVRELLNLVLAQFQGTSDQSLCDLYDKLTTQIRALDTLGVTSEKYAAMLYPMVESALPGDILRAFERTPQQKGNDRLTQLLEFLKREVESIQRIDMARSGFTSVKGDVVEREPTAATLVSSGTTSDNKSACLFCDKLSHATNDCYKVFKLSFEEKKAIIQKKKLCSICLRSNHPTKACRSFVKCLICLKRHNTVICNEIGKHQPKIEDKKNKGKESVKQHEIASSSTSMSVCNNKPVVLLQTLVVKVVFGTSEIKVRALIDNGSQRSYILKDLAKNLELKHTEEENLVHSVFGGKETDRRCHKVYDITVRSLDNTAELNMSVLDEIKICGLLPRVNIRELQQTLNKHNIELTDIGNIKEEISLLIGADYAGLILTNVLVQIGDLTAIKTKLGWTVQGAQASVLKQTHTLISLVDLDVTDFWKLESIGINDSPKDATADEVFLKFEDSIKINKEGRYETPLPWKNGHQDLLPNKELAFKRLLSTTKRLNATGYYKGYDDAFKEWIQLGIIEQVPEDDGDGHYLAHHAVIKSDPSATTKIRPVFDGSAKDKNGISINGCLEKGENLLETIPTLLIMFRKHAIGITSDIKKAFLQISIIPEDRKYLKFLWWKNDEQKELDTYQHCRVVFGLTCSPFLLAATINHHLLHCTKERTVTAERLRTSFYVDNCVTSVEDQFKADKFISEAKQIMNDGKFELRGWITVPQSKFCQTAEQVNTSILGVNWNTSTDELGCFSFSVPEITKKLTKRMLLSIAQKIFDPIGFTAPVTLIPKVILQKCWMKDFKWDDDLPEEIISEFQSWFSSIHLLKHCNIPRRLAEYTLNESQVNLHVFCDASQAAYATCIFLRTECNQKVSVRLVLAKTRVAPTKQKITIPRLELLAATIAARLADNIKKALQLDCGIYYWTDSKVVLTWIKKSAQWAVFVNNRVKEIKRLTRASDWFHLPGNYNPADLPSRGCDAKTLLDLRWWEGPKWLYKDEHEWPKSDDQEPHMDTIVQQELSKTTVHLDTVDNFLDDLNNYFSQYTKIVRTLAWIKRFFLNCRNSKQKGRNGKVELTCEEYKDAEICLLRLVQDSILEKKINVETIKDENGIIRVKTKLTHAPERNEFTYPILLVKHPITEKLVAHIHQSMQHAGTSIIMGRLREEYWIVGCRRLVRNVVKNCGKCRRFNSRPVQTQSAPLPLSRIDCTTTVFETSGVDLAGPLFLASGEKCYIVLFTCAVYRAIHLEIITSLSTEAFIMALRRFFARRGRVKTMYSDNGTNFHGAVNLLESLDWNKLETETSIRKIKWIFSPPTAPWWGGWWERMVRTIKDLLRRVLGKAVLNYEELQTVVCDVESIINMRPLTYVTEEETLVPLTPNVFLRGHYSQDENDDLDMIDEKSLNTKFKKMQSLREALRQRFRSEYLAMLAQKKPKGLISTLKPGDVVLVQNDAKRTIWPLGLILEVHHGNDGIPRVAKIRTSSGEKTRPFQRLYPLEINNSEILPPDQQKQTIAKEIIQPKQLTQSNNNKPIESTKTTRSGRKIKIPEKLSI